MNQSDDFSTSTESNTVISLQRINEFLRQSFRGRGAILAFALLAGIWAISASLLLFPYYSIDHDEPVYVFQAKNLLQGRLTTPVDELSPFFHTWFAHNDGHKIYPKYTPAHAGVLAAGELFFGSMRVSLGLVAAANVVLVYLLGLELFHRRSVALLATSFFAFSPIFLIQSATFLSYNSALTVELSFALCFLRATRTQSRGSFVCAGFFLGLAAFARPFDAILFGLPFGIRFAWLLFRERQFQQWVGQALLMAVGLIPPMVTLFAVNATITGNAFTFPFTKYEPTETLGFGEKRQTPVDEPIDFDFAKSRQALGVNSLLLTLWICGGPLLVVAAVAYFTFAWRDWRSLILLALLVAFPLGFLLFWGPYNVAIRWPQGAAQLGPFYYYPCVVPLALLAARGLSLLMQARPRLFYVYLGIMIITTVRLLVPALTTNYAYIPKNRALYECIEDQLCTPIENHELSSAVVFVPPIYGPQLLHPFSLMANSPTYDGPIVYAVNRANDNFRLLDHFADRKPFLFVCRGDFTQEPTGKIETDVVPISRYGFGTLFERLQVTNTSNRRYVYASLWNNENSATYLLDDNSRHGQSYDITWSISAAGANLNGVYLRQLSELTALSAETTLNFSIAFADDELRQAQEIYERRYWFRIFPNGFSEIADPAEEWYNPLWPAGAWQRENVAEVIRVSGRDAWHEPPYPNTQKTTWVTNQFTERLRIVNPGNRSFVFAYLFNEDQTATYLLDRNSSRGKAYDVNWVISQNGVRFQGEFLQQTSSMGPLAESGSFAIAVAFASDEERSMPEIFEKRYAYKHLTGGSLQLELPPDPWLNRRLTVTPWVRSDVSEVLKRRLSSPSESTPVSPTESDDQDNSSGHQRVQDPTSQPSLPAEPTAPLNTSAEETEKQETREKQTGEESTDPTLSVDEAKNTSASSTTESDQAIKAKPLAAEPLPVAE